MADDKKTDSNELTELTGDLDLLGDWLDAKGYGEEAGLCTRVMDHMHKQDARISELEAALKPFADGEYITDEHLRAACQEAADALEEKDKLIAKLEANAIFWQKDALHTLQIKNEGDARIAALEAALKNCADDLEAEIDARYRILPGGTIHAATLADYDRDMATVREARWVLEGKDD